MSTMKVVSHVRRLITEMIESVIESSRGGEIKVMRRCPKYFETFFNLVVIRVPNIYAMVKRK